MSSARIAFFDFDGTITDRDSLLEFIKYSKGSGRYWLGFAWSSPWIIAWKAGLISNQQAKERVLRHFFRRLPVPDFKTLCLDFAQRRLPGMIRPKAVGEIRKLQQEGFSVVIVSASPGDWIEPWATAAGAGLIASRLGTMEVTSRRKSAAPTAAVLTGRISGKNCHGEEKVRRIRAEYRLEDYEAIYAYGDSRADLPMLALGTRTFYKPFR
ncbi:MAG: HAD family hydrolase [Bacteroidota bacterium]|nr:HAD family hydrolase [Bacteroidota bacterium]MDP4215154.1 HAD family hydrolase [Bacteroidota bacterium]MDP4246749.1 HAD family hydrolase [Bacteroidota bacterium]MDP4255020.1 HAD family hydrolase [Bacteroidota bacterium]MDP4258722.1 HAD family hydrolase [Bacteroidota bacterium]